jgi:CSLREA domain-containing protein
MHLSKEHYRWETVCTKVLFVLSMTLALSISVAAMDLVVTKVEDTDDGVCDNDCSLREAIGVANAIAGDDTILFDPSFFSIPRTITIVRDIRIFSNGAVEVRGAGFDVLTIDGGNHRRIFSIPDGANVSIANLTMIGGTGFGLSTPGVLGGGAIANIGGSLALYNVRIAECYASSGGYGGAVYNSGILSISNSTLNDNNTGHSGGKGGAVYNASGSSLSVFSSSILDNSSEDGEGGGIYNQSGVTTDITGSYVDGNSADGGGIYDEGGTLTILGTHFQNNTVPTSMTSATGGGIRKRAGTLLIIDSSFNNNSSHSGGGVAIEGGNATITGSDFTGNQAFRGSGGAIWTSATAMVIRSSRLINNVAANAGGALAQAAGITGSSSTLEGSIIRGNTAFAGGGLALLGTFSYTFTVNLDRSVVTENTAVTGGGIDSGCYGGAQAAGTLNVTNTSIVENSATIRAAAICAGQFHHVNLNYSTVAYNHAPQIGGMQNANGYLSLHATIVGDNTADTGGVTDVLGNVTSRGYNLIEDVSTANISGDLTGDMTGIDPGLIPLRDNGGQLDSIALQPGSLAMDAGDPNSFPAIDGRGFERAKDGNLDGVYRADIGAYESQVLSFTVTKIEDTDDNICDEDCSLREAIAAAANSTTPDKGIDFAPFFHQSSNTISLLHGQLNLASNGTIGIYGPGRDLLTISAGLMSRNFKTESGGFGLLQGVTIENGNDLGTVAGDGGGAVRAEGTLNVVESLIRNSNAAGLGGGILAVGTAKLTIRRSQISNNTAGLSGGGVADSALGAAFYNSTINSNFSGLDGGGIWSNGQEFKAVQADVKNNLASQSGGGIFINANTGPVKVEMLKESTVDQNSALSRGGGIYNSLTNNSFSIADSTISRNSAVNGGGGIYNAGGVTVSNSTVGSNIASDNATGSGGGILNELNISVTQITIAGNNAQVGGGGVRNDGSFDCRSSLIGDNHAGVSSPDFLGTLNSQGFNFVEDVSGTTISGTGTGNLLGQDAMLGSLTNNGGGTETFALLPGSPALDKGASSTLVRDQRGFPRPYDFPGIPNAQSQNGSDIGSFERQPAEPPMPTPTGTPTNTPSPTASSTPTPTFSPTSSPTGTPSTPSPTATSTPTNTPTLTPTNTPTPTSTPTATPPPTGCYPVITQSVSHEISVGTSVYCSSGENSYWRVFPLSQYHISSVDTYVVSSVDFGIEKAITETGIQPVTIRLYRQVSGSFPNGQRTMIASATAETEDQSFTIVNVPIAAVIPPGTTQLIMEVATPGLPANQGFFTIGSNPQDQTGATYISAPACGFTTPTNVTSLLPRMHIVFDVFGSCNSATPTPTNTPTLTPTATPTNTPTGTPIVTPTNTPTATPTSVPSPSAEPDFDYDGDGKTDISVFRPLSGAWYLQRSMDGMFGAEFGYGSDKIAPADYDGDRKTDIAVYRPETSIWYVFQSSTGTVDYTVFGVPEDLPTAADYDGDGKADVSVFRPSTATWYRQNSSDGSFHAIQFGLPDDKPTIGDFDGDGKSDIAIFRPSDGAWYQLYSSDGSVHGRQFGFGTDILTPADYDGDGKTDIAVYRPSEGYWYIANSSDGNVTYAVFGLGADIPAPGDFDGDSKSDISVFRPSDGNWYRRNSSDGSFFAYQFGVDGDKPTQTAFRY